MFWYIIVVLIPSAEAEAFVDSRCCSGTYSEPKADDEVIAYDHVTRKIRSEPEGATKHYVHSVFFCPNGRLRQKLCINSAERVNT